MGWQSCPTRAARGGKTCPICLGPCQQDMVIRQEEGLIGQP